MQIPYIEHLCRELVKEAEDPFTWHTDDCFEILTTSPVLRKLMIEFAKGVIPKVSTPDELFIKALAQLKDTGDIDVLVRHLSWQQNDIAFLSHQLKDYESTLVKLDKSLSDVARLRDSCNRLRKRNGELLHTIRSLSKNQKKL